MRVAVLVLTGLEEKARFSEATDDLVGRLRGREPVEPAVRVVEVACLVHRAEDGQVVDPAELEVLLARSRRDVHDAASLLDGNVVPGDDPMLDLGSRPEVVERPAVPQPDELEPSTVRTNASSG